MPKEVNSTVATKPVDLLKEIILGKLNTLNDPSKSAVTCTRLYREGEFNYDNLLPTILERQQLEHPKRYTALNRVTLGFIKRVPSFFWRLHRSSDRRYECLTMARSPDKNELQKLYDVLNLQIGGTDFYSLKFNILVYFFFHDLTEDAYPHSNYQSRNSNYIHESEALYQKMIMKLEDYFNDRVTIRNVDQMSQLEMHNLLDNIASLLVQDTIDILTSDFADYVKPIESETSPEVTSPVELQNLV